MTQLAIGTDFVQLPADSSGKKTAMLAATVSGGSPLYIPASIAVDEAGNTLVTINGLFVQGSVASGATDAGSPVKVGGKYNSTPPTLTDGQRGDIQVDSRANLRVALVASNSNTALASANPGDGSDYSSARSLDVNAILTGFNGTNWDLVRVANSGRLQVDVITGGGTQYVEDVALGATPTGTLGMGRYRTTLTGLTYAIGDAAAMHIDGYGALWTIAKIGSNNGDVAGIVQPSDTDANSFFGLRTIPFLMGFNGTTWDRVRVANTGRLQVDVVTGGGGGTQYTEDAALPANPTGTILIAKGEGTLSTAVADGDAVALSASPAGVLRVVLADPNTGAEPIIEDSASDSLGTSSRGLRVNSLLHGYTGSAMERIRNITAFKTASSTPDVGLQAAISPDRRYTALSLATAVNSVQAWDVNGANVALIHIGNGATGTLTFEVSADGSNWIAAEVRDISVDLWVSGTNITPVANKVYRIITNGHRLFRARTVTTLGATVALTVTLSAVSTVLNAIDTGPAPHAIGYAITSKTAQYTTTQTGAALWTPATGKRIVITYYQIQAGGTTAGTMQLWFGASGDTTYSRGTDLAIFDGEFAPSATLKPGVVQDGVFQASAVDHILRVTDSAAINPLTVTVWGYES